MTPRWRYAEDRVGVTWLSWFYVAAPILVQAVVSVVTPVAVWSTTLGVAAFAEIIAVILLREGWKTGIRVGDDEVAIGGCRRAERLAARGREPKAVIDPHFRLRSQFTIPVQAIRTARVVPRAEFDQDSNTVLTPAGGSRHPRARIALVNLATPSSAAALVLVVDLDHARMPAMTTYMRQSFTRVRTASRYVVTNRWTVSTRHPAALSAALTSAGVPVVPADASALTAAPHPTS